MLGIPNWFVGDAISLTVMCLLSLQNLLFPNLLSLILTICFPGWVFIIIRPKGIEYSLWHFSIDCPLHSCYSSLSLSLHINAHAQNEEMSGIDSIYDRLRPGLVDAFRNIFPPGFPFNVPAPATPIPTYKPAVPYDAVSGLSDSDYETSFGQTGSGSTISSLAMVLTTSFWVGIYDFTSHEVYQFASFNFALTFQPHDLNLYNLWSDWFKFHGPDNEYCAIFGYL